MRVSDQGGWYYARSRARGEPATEQRMARRFGVASRPWDARSLGLVRNVEVSIVAVSFRVVATTTRPSRRPKL